MLVTFINAKFFTDRTKVSLLIGFWQNNFMFLFNGIIVSSTSKDVTGEILNRTKITISMYPI